ncbi:PBP1A family penicillin-binding protein [Metabacillus herbersteinensis]|uniref:PBP1A family penicillin-binding protein n=1 Tax=Metabacillus herbersteinensis TaxID=283816 RepID=A0ABV6GD89_9BACI
MSDQYKSREERKKALAANKPKRKKKPDSSPLWKKILLAVLAIGVVGMIAGGVTFAVLISGAPPLDDKKLKDSFSSKIYDVNGDEITEVGQEKRIYVPYDEIPEVLEQAVLATEDTRFYEHNGVDFIRIGGAFIANVQEGFGAEGGSTITQQVIKNSLLSTEKTITRKVQELWLAFQLEQKYSKQEILEMYLNKIYFPGNTYGVAKAAESLYGKENLKELELHEAAMLAGLPQSPNNYNPRTNPELAEKRRNTVLNLMAKNGFITTEEAEAAKQTSVTATLVEPKEKANPFHAFVEEVIEEVKDKTDIDVGSAGLEIYTTLDPAAQEHVENVLNGDLISYPDENFQAGVALIDTKSGEIRAIGGGINQPVGGYNFATDSRRQPGSAIKPVLDYGPAIEHLKWSTFHPIVDEPYNYSDTDSTPIRNYDRNYKGQMSIRTALADSRNVPAVKALQEVGLDKAQAFAQGLGIPLEKIYESYALGGFDYGVSPLQMAGAFSAFGNNGLYIEPHAVKKVVLSDGTEVNLAPEADVAMSDYTAFMITDMMISVVQSGTGTAAQVPGVTVAGKTGTTNFTAEDQQKYNIPNGAAKDSWFVGYNPNYTAAVWTGYPTIKKDEKSYLEGREEQGLSRAIFKEVFSEIAKGDNSDFKQPKSVVQVAVEKGSSEPLRSSKFTPKDQIAYEYFVKGTEPSKESKKYQKLDKPGNLQINYDQESNAISLKWNYNKELLENISFEVSQSIDEGPYQVITKSKDLALTLPDVIPGAIYKFQVIAVSDEDGENQSDPSATLLEVPEAIEEETPELPVPGEGDEEDKDKGKDKGNDDNVEDEEEIDPLDPLDPLDSVDDDEGNQNGNGNGNGNGNRDEDEEDDQNEPSDGGDESENIE